MQEMIFFSKKRKKNILSLKNEYYLFEKSRLNITTFAKLKTSHVYCEHN